MEAMAHGTETTAGTAGLPLGLLARTLSPHTLVRSVSLSHDALGVHLASYAPYVLVRPQQPTEPIF